MQIISLNAVIYINMNQTREKKDRWNNKKDLRLLEHHVINHSL